MSKLSQHLRLQGDIILLESDRALPLVYSFLPFRFKNMFVRLSVLTFSTLACLSLVSAAAHPRRSSLPSCNPTCPQMDDGGALLGDPLPDSDPVACAYRRVGDLESIPLCKYDKVSEESLCSNVSMTLPFRRRPAVWCGMVRVRVSQTDINQTLIYANRLLLQLSAMHPGQKVPWREIHRRRARPSRRWSPRLSCQGSSVLGEAQGGEACAGGGA